MPDWGDIAIRTLSGLLTAGNAPVIGTITDWTGLDKPLKKVADAYDRAVDDNIRWKDKLSDDLLAEMKRDKSAWYYPTYVNMKVGDNLLAGIQHLGGGLVDLLRFGDSYRDPTGWNLVKDVLRVSTIVDVANSVAGPLFKVVHIDKAKMIPGGAMSCGFTSWLKGVVDATGRVIPIEELARALGLPWTRLTGALAKTVDDAASLGFRGVDDTMPWTLSRIFRQFGVQSNVEHLAGAPADALDQLFRKVSTSKDPYYFGFIWKDVVKNGQAAPGGGHYMTAYEWFGEVRLMDQFGTWVSRLSSGTRVFENVRPTELGRAHQFLKIYMDSIKDVVHGATHIHGLKLAPMPLLGRSLALGNLVLPVIPVPLGPLYELVVGKAKSPSPAGLQVPSDVPKAKVGLAAKIHVVQRGDTLFGLAKKYYRDAARFQSIVQVNASLAGTPGHQQLPIGYPVFIPNP